MPPRALRPVGIALVDKPAGPSSFALVAALRRRTRARTGHAGTLDPFATGLLVLLSGAATRLAPCFVGLDKRYVTDVDLTSDDDDRRPGRARSSSSTRRRRAPQLDDALARLRGEIELPIPAASAVKIGGERAYKLARRGVAVEMPLRRSLVHALDVVAYTGDDAVTACGSSCTSARAPTCARSRRRSAATARRCGGRPSGRSRSTRRAVETASCCRRRRRSSGCRPTRSSRVPDGRAGRRARARARAGEAPRERRAPARASSSGGRARSRSARSTACTSVTAP